MRYLGEPIHNCPSHLFFLQVSGNPTTMSIDMESHFHPWISISCSSPVGLWCSIFTHWQVAQLATYLATSYFMLLHQNVYFRSLYSLFPPRCSECDVLCPSSKIFFLSSSTLERTFSCGTLGGHLHELQIQLPSLIAPFSYPFQLWVHILGYANLFHKGWLRFHSAKHRFSL